MQLRDATSVYGRVVILIPLILVILTFADSAFACPGHTNGAAYRTRVKIKSASQMPTTVISYRAPATYRRCGNNLYDTRGARYVSNGHHGGARYIAVRNGGGYYKTARTTRYIAVRNTDHYDDTPRYVAVRRQPMYVDHDVRYVAVRRSQPRVRYVAVRDIENDDDDDVRYVTVRRSVPRTKYVAVRNVDMDRDDVRYVSERTYAPRVRQVVVHDDDQYSNGMKHVVVKSEIDYDDDEYVSAPAASYVEHDDDDEEYTGTRTVSYSPARYMDDDVDRWAYLDGGRATYVAANDFDDACMMNRVAVRSPREVVINRAASYVPVEGYVDDDAEHLMTEDVDPAPVIRHVAMDDDVGYVDEDIGTVSYSPVSYVQDVDTEEVNYLPVDDVEEIETEPVSYMQADDMHDATVSYVPVDEIDNTYISADACPMAVSSVDAEPIYVVDESTVLVENSGVEMVGTRQIAGTFGYRDGFEDGRDAALEGDEYHPENSGDFKKATEGYEDDFGDKDIYKDAYRSEYLDGYQAGFESAASTV